MITKREVFIAGDKSVHKTMREAIKADAHYMLTMDFVRVLKKIGDFDNPLELAKDLITELDDLRKSISRYRAYLKRR